MFRKCLVLTAFVCGPLVLWAAHAQGQEVEVTPSLDVLTVAPASSFHPPLLLYDIPIGFTSAVPVSTQQQTWGKTKVELGRPEETAFPQLSLGAYTFVRWPFQEHPSLWSGWTGDRTSESQWHRGADFYARDLNRIGCGSECDRYKRVYASINGRLISRWESGYGNTVIIYDASRHFAVRYAHLQEVYGVCGSVRVGDCIGTVGNSGCGDCTPHLHICGYENINDNGGNPVIPTASDSDYYSCALYFQY